MRNLVSVVSLLALAALAVPGTTLASTSPPTVGSFSPAKGPVGTLVKIHGTNLNNPGLQVTFGGTAAAPEYVSATIILVRVPALAPSGIILVKTRYGSAPSHTRFVVTKGLASFPRGAWPGQQVTIAGSGLSPNHDFTLKLDGHPFGGVATNANGEFSTIRTLPGDLTVGPSHVLVAIDSITHVSQKLHIWVFGNWPQPRNDPAETGSGTQEFTINTTNVTKGFILHGWGGITTPAVEDNGWLYVGLNNGGGTYVIKFDPWTQGSQPAGGWYGATDGVVARATAVANGVVYAVTDDRLYAFAESTNVPNPQPLWTALLGDAAHPFAPVVADGHVYVANAGTSILQTFDAKGVTNCGGSPKVCTPLWFNSFQQIFGSPAIDAKSEGGTGDVYISVRNGGVNKVVVRTPAGVAAGASAALAGTSLSGPSLGGGRIFVSGWSAGSATANLYALDASTQALLWNSGDLGGSAAPTAVSIGGGHTFVQNSAGILKSFKSAGCGTAVCDPLWSSTAHGAGGTTPPAFANGVVYSAAHPFDGDISEVWAYDANGCGSATCAELSSNADVGINSQITVIAGTIFGQANNTLEVGWLP